MPARCVNENAFQGILLSQMSNLNDYAIHISINIQTWSETTELLLTCVRKTEHNDTK